MIRAMLSALCCVSVFLLLTSIFAPAAMAQNSSTQKKSGASAPSSNRVVNTKKKAPPPPAPKKQPPAATKKAPAPKKPVAPAPPPPPISYICVDAASGTVLSEENADMKRPPASMIKLVLMLMVAKGLENGVWNENTPINVTANAQNMGGTQVFIKAGETWPLDHMMYAVAVASANDAAMAVAESLWGSKDDYLKAANEFVATLGMTSTTLHGVHGLPPGPGGNFDQTTARDMAILARECVKQHKILQWVGRREFALREGNAPSKSTNLLMERMPDCDGLKTGFIRAAGFCIAATAERNDIRLVSVVMGFQDKYQRFNQAQELLEAGFKMFQPLKIVRRGDAIDTPVALADCLVQNIRPVAASDTVINLKLVDIPRIQYSAVLQPDIAPPVIPQQIVGKLRVRLDGQLLAEVPLQLPEDLSPCGWQRVEVEGKTQWQAPKKKRGWFRRD